jgi:tetratricopeptide (TPR) repeat protein
MKIGTPTLRHFVCLAIFFTAITSVTAQSGDDAAREIIVKALTLYQQQRYSEAVPYMAMLVEAAPDAAEIRFAYAVSLLGKSKQVSNTEEAKQLSAKALEQFVKAKELGHKGAEIDAFISLLSGKAVARSDGGEWSPNKDANKSMVEAENYFAQSRYDEAIKRYEKALKSDPTIYRAALGGGDAFTAKGDWTNAEKWYQRAIAIDPNRETGYRYSGTPLMKQQKYDLARERYIEALITEPYNDMSRRGIGQWAQVTGAKLGHPSIPIPEVTFDLRGNAIATSASGPWLAYIKTREAWKKDRFAKSFPKEATYRHSLPEEAEALRAVISAAAEQKTTDPQLQMLIKMDADGVLEAFILMAVADEGIAADHPEFLKNNRPKLRRYVADYVIAK